jgi:hypothetical protein
VVEDQGQIGDLTTLAQCDWGRIRMSAGRGRIWRPDSARSRSHCRRRCDHDGWTGFDSDPPYA